MDTLLRTPSRRAVLGTIGATAAICSVGRAFAAFPEKPITVIVPFPPGGPNDIIGRLTAQILSGAFGAQAIVENRPGAGGATAVATVARGDADGYVAVLPSGVGFVTQPLLSAKAPFKTEDLRPVSNVTSGPSVIAVKRDLPVKSLEEFVALAKKQPGGLTYASSGVGTTLHLGGELFKSVAGIDLVHVPYKGTSEVVVDLVAGRVDMSIISPLVARKLVDDDRLSALATTGKTRPKGWENVPTVAEAGVAGYELDGWYPLLVPAGTPDDVVETLSQAVQKGIKSPDAVKRLEDLGFMAIGSTVKEAEDLQRAETAKWSDLIATAKLQVN